MDFPRGPVVNAGGTGSIPGQGTKIPHAAQHSLKKKKSQLKIISNFEFQRIREGKKMLLIGVLNLFIVLLLGLIFKTFCYYKSHSL